MLIVDGGLRSRLLGRLGRSPSTRLLLEKLGAPQMLVGYRRPFATLEAAQQALGKSGGQGHASQESISAHVNLSEQPRISDYPAFYHLAPHAPQIRRLFDVGGCIGNLYYYYTRFLQLHPDAEWLTMDLPAVVDEGRRIAQERNATRLKFTADFSDADGSDLMIASGSLHYFDEPLPAMIGRLGKRPRHVLINRTPMTDRPDFATIQENRTYRIPCVIYNRARLISLFEGIGYRLVDQCEAPELSMSTPLYPEYTVKTYTGMFFAAD
jgi:putative methyltransferase (TIGR04325 family)